MDAKREPGRESPVTVIVGRRVRQGREADYRRWVDGIVGEARRAPGLLRGEVFPPVPGVQAEWMVLLQFARPGDLDAWSRSAERRAWMARGEEMGFTEGEPTFHTVSGLETWFAPTGAAARATTPPRTKMAVAVLIVLYPLVLLSAELLLPRLASLPLPLRVLISTALIVVVMTWLAMPFVTNHLLRAWLFPVAPPASGSSEAR